MTYMMWLNLIKSREWLNQNFSNKSQNRIGFKYGFCICLSVLIITFEIKSQIVIYGIGKLITNATNLYEIAFFKLGSLLWQNCPSIKDHKSGRIWNHFLT
jgi:hypothetical protein